jgi:hypothetical protein
VNLCGATAPRAEHKQGPKLLYVETDPVYEQFNVANGDELSRGFLASHDVLFTYGENIGRTDCIIPTAGFTWHATRPAGRHGVLGRARRRRRQGVHDRSRRSRTRARTSRTTASPTSGRSIPPSCASSTSRAGRRSRSSWP